MAATTLSGADVLADAQRYLGVPYKYGGTSRSSGLDCSGLVLVVCQDIGITSCPRTSEEQWAWASRIDAASAGAGDLVFFTGAELDPPPGHVGFLVASGRMINAPFTGAVVRYDNFDLNGTGINAVTGYGRIPGVNGSASANPSVMAPSGPTPEQQAAAGFGAGVGSVLVLLVMGAIILGALFLVFFITR